MHHDLVALIAARTRDGELPATHAFRTWGGLSAGSRCVLCEQRLEIGDCEIEIEWSDSRSRRKAILHPSCLTAWMDALPGPATPELQTLTGT